MTPLSIAALVLLVLWFTLGIVPVPRTPSAAPMTVCPDCGGRGWRRQVGAFACACLAGQLHMLTARVVALEAEREHDNG